MSLSPEIRDQAYQFFVEEAQELLQTIELGLLGLRQDSSTAKIHEIMRAAHSLKGGAASVELEAIKTISHRLETIFKALYNDSVILDATLETALLQGYDCLRIPLESQIKTGTLDEVLALEQAEPALSHLESLLKEAIQDSEGYVPSSQDLGIDIVASIFEVDVAQGLARWQDVLAHPEHCPVAGELRAQLEVFAGLAEILELPGFGELTQTALAAVERHPDRALEVLTLALADFQQAHDQVLRGDRRQGGTPSSALKALAGDISGVGPSDAVLSDAVLSDIVPSDVVSSNFGLTEPRNPVEIPEKSDLNTDLASFPSLESVFGEIGADEGFRSLDDSLGVGMGEQTGEEIGERIGDAIGDGVEERLPLDTGFGEFGPVEVVTDSGSPPSLDAIFGGGAESEVESQPDRGQGSDQDFGRDSDKNLGDLPSLESVFGNGADLGDPPSLGAVFGNAVDLDNLSGSKAEDDRPEISDLIDEVTANFDRLPSLAEGATGGTLTTRDLDRSALVAPHTPTIHPPEPTPLQTKPRSQAPGRSVRVDLQRLERMNNLVGELVINRNSLSLQNEQLQAVVQELSDRFECFQTLLTQLRQSSDLMLVDTAQESAQARALRSITPSSPLPQPSSFPPETTALSSDRDFSALASNRLDHADFLDSLQFDRLEMDRYSHLHGQLQEIFEEALQLEEAVNDINLFAEQSTRSLQQQNQQLNQLQNELMWSRMLPLGEVLNRFPRVLRDLSNRFQKPVNLKLTGAAVLIDKSILDKLHDPLLHLLRNAFDHGIEPTEIRRHRGKPEEATIEIRAYHRGNQTIIEIQDDGRGIDLEKVSRRALDLGWISPDNLSQLKTDRLYAFLFEPGFSTAAQVTELSGRGVGLDVVKSQIEGLKGNVSVISAAQKGTTFTLRLPLTLTITKLLIIQADQQPLALPSDSLEEIIIPKPEQYKQTGHNLFLHWRNQLIPSYNLQHLIQYSRPVSGTVTLPRLAALQAPPDWLLPLLIVRRGAYSFAVQVDRILTEQELVVKPFNPAIAPPPYLYGCTVLGDGRLVPVMDASLLVDYCHNSPILGSNSSIMGNSLAGQHVGQLPNPMPGPDWNQSSDSKSDPTSPSCSPSGSLLALPQPSLPQSAVSTSFPAIPHPSSPSTADIPLTILVVDDSAALRRTLALTLQKAGYHVLQARDGLEALEQLQKHQGVALVICDVEMPNMNGFEFLSQRRKQTNLAEIPVFMLTSRSNQKHRLLAQTLGATSYFTKPYLEQELLQALTQLFQSC